MAFAASATLLRHAGNDCMSGSRLSIWNKRASV